MKSAKLSDRTTPKLRASVSHSITEETAAPTRPISPSPKSGIRSPGWRKASASIAAIAASMTLTMGMMAT